MHKAGSTSIQVLFYHLDDGRKRASEMMRRAAVATAWRTDAQLRLRYASNPPRARALKALKLCRYDSLWSVSAVL